MSVTSGEFWFLVLVLLTVGIGILFIAILVMHFLMPKRVLETYFKPPYFKPAECAMFSGIPFGYIRTIMFMRVLAFPGSGKVRGLTEAYTMAPGWYHGASKIIVILLLADCVAMFFVYGGFGIYILLSGE